MKTGARIAASQFCALVVFAVLMTQPILGQTSSHAAGQTARAGTAADRHDPKSALTLFFRDISREAGLTTVPNSSTERRYVAETMGGGGIALLEWPGVRRPHLDEPMFHVERCPVHPPPTSMSAVLDELVDPGVDHLDRQRLGELGERPRELTLDLRNRGLASGHLDTQAQGNGRWFDRRGPAEYHQARLPVRNQPFRIAGAEGAAASQEKDGLEQ